MSQNFQPADSDTIERQLCKQLESVRLMKNVSQSKLAEQAGVSRRTISRMENGEGVSLDTFIRVMLALNLADQLQSLIPDSNIRPIERVQRRQERKHASSPRNPKPTEDWEWGDEE